MNYMDSGGILCEAQDERLKTLAKILLPGLALLIVPVLFSESKLLSVPGALEILVPGLGVLFVISAFCTRCRVTLTSDKRVLEVKYRLLAWDFDKMEFGLSHVRHVCLDWDDQPPFLAALVKGIHPVSVILDDGQRKVLLQAKTASCAEDFARLIQGLIDSARETAPQQ